uniref:ATP synthase complex subunit 8 n=1 Tax=Lamiinae sp. GENSP02 TaxID=1205560 RepID=A0A0S2MS69_9CUCU|nr:ATP synthase F0 subunit 8 [Lamiinae sp. GENSP02]
MPQMAPLSWLYLFILFLTIFLLFNIKNYYIFYYKIKLLDKKKYVLYNWKW